MHENEMIAFSIHDHDRAFHSLPFTPIILNDVPARTKEERDALNAMIMTTYDHTDTLDSIPSCSCGHLSYGYNLGQLCPKCNTRVEAAGDQEIVSNVWFRAPQGVHSLVNPMLWMILSPLMTGSRFNVLQWFCAPLMEDPPESNKKASMIMHRLMKTGIPRGLNNFIAHFDDIAEAILTLLPRQERESMQTFFTVYRDRFFPQHLPMPNKIAFVMENTATGTYADTAIREALDAARTITSIDEETYANVRRLEGKITSIINSLASYYSDMFGDPFSKKEGLLRNTVFGGRTPFAFRSVIVSESGVHDYEQIKIPYSQAVTMFKVHLLNKLYKKGYTHRDAWEYIDRHTITRDALLEELLYEIFQEAPGGKGVRCLWVRYPTLARGSIQALHINDISDNVSSLSVLCTRAPNADRIGI